MIAWITCREVVDFLDDYMSGALDPGLTARFERHLSECPPCVAYMNAYRTATALGRAALKDPDAEARSEVPEDLVQAILRARKSDES